MRQSSADIDHAILDVAAGLFATHGYAHTSVQQVADAVGYSKPGLLHRFGSKDALHRAVLAEVSRTAQAVLDHALATRHRPDQVTGVLEVVTRRALERPGMARMMLHAFRADSREPGSEPIRAAGHRLVEVLHRPPTTAADRLRLVLALELVVTAAGIQHSPRGADLHVEPDELVALLVSVAGGVARTGGRLG